MQNTKANFTKSQTDQEARATFQDQIAAIHKMFAKTHKKWVKALYYGDSTVPAIMIYTKEFLQDLSNHIGSKGQHQEPCGIDKTYNLGSAYATLGQTITKPFMYLVDL